MSDKALLYAVMSAFFLIWLGATIQKEGLPW